MQEPDFSDVEAHVAYLDGLAQSRAREARRLADDISAIEGTGADEHALVAVRVDNTGRLTGIRFKEQARALPPHALSSAVMQAYARACIDFGKKAKAVVDDASDPLLQDAMRQGVDAVSKPPQRLQRREPEALPSRGGF